MYLVLLQTQSSAGAALEIIVMLLGAAIIGVVTTVFYMKSKYKQTINTLESKLEAAEKSKDLFREELASVKKELEQLRQQYNEQLNKEELLKRISERRHMIDYSRIGTARRKDMDDLKMISGIGPVIEEQLHTLDIYTFEQISKFTTEDIEAVTEAIEFFPGRIERDEWVKQAKELA
jgi:predicted flap endonuclease-1-like 5' DNA nuclease